MSSFAGRRHFCRFTRCARPFSSASSAFHTLQTQTSFFNFRSSSLSLNQPTLAFTPVRHSHIITTDTTPEEYRTELDILFDRLTQLLERDDLPASGAADKLKGDISLVNFGVDSVYSDGVLRVSSPKLGTWVINRNAPTRQVWLSSPISGPRKYNFHRNYVDIAQAPPKRYSGSGESVPSNVRGSSNEFIYKLADKNALTSSACEGWLGEKDTSDSLKLRLLSEWSQSFNVHIDRLTDFTQD